MQLTWLSLLPPLIVIGAVCVTHQLNISLAMGIFCASLIVTQGQLLPALMMCGQKFVSHVSDIDNIYLYLLLITISSLRAVRILLAKECGQSVVLKHRLLCFHFY
jgi:hypothetical protein